MPLPLGEVPAGRRGFWAGLCDEHPLSHGFAVPAPPEGEPRGRVCGTASAYRPSSVPGCARSTFPVGEGFLPAGDLKTPPRGWGGVGADGPYFTVTLTVVVALGLPVVFPFRKIWRVRVVVFSLLTLTPSLRRRVQSLPLPEMISKLVLPLMVT